MRCETALTGLVQHPTPGEHHPYDLIKEHVIRYFHALKQVRGARVIDLGCGSEFGSTILAESADEVVAAGRSKSALQLAMHEYPHPKIHYVHARLPEERVIAVSAELGDAVAPFVKLHFARRDLEIAYPAASSGDCSNLALWAEGELHKFGSLEKKLSHRPTKSRKEAELEHLEVATLNKESSVQLAACTIAAKNYLPHAFVLAESFLRFNPRSKVFLLLEDESEAKSFDERLIIVKLEDLKIKNVDTLLFKYDLLEFSAAVRPFFLEFLLNKGFSKLVYLDADILVIDNFHELSKILNGYNFALTPHLLAGLPNDGRRPGELDIVIAGTYNLGFISIRDTAETRQFLDWWKARVYDYRALEPLWGMHVDQKWIDLAVGIFPGFYIIRDPGYNVAYWNMGSRRITRKDGHYFVNDQPLRFVHFSGFDPDHLDRVSKHQDRYSLHCISEYKPIFRQYRSLLKTHGYDKSTMIPWRYNYYDNGEHIPYLARQTYRENKELQDRYPSPFSTRIENSFYSWFNTNYKTHSFSGKPSNAFDITSRQIVKSEGPTTLLRQSIEKASKFVFKIALEPIVPQPSPAQDRDMSSQNEKRSEFGVNLAGYFTGRFGIAASSRAFAEGLRISGIPHVLNNLGHGTFGNPHPELWQSGYSFAVNNPYPINLIHVNADALDASFRDIKYCKGRYNIGIWYWELSRFPNKFAPAFNLVDEIWVTSNFIAEALSKVSPVPVVKITYPLFMPELVPEYAAARRRFDFVDGECVYLFVFDFRSIFERKNPISLVRAFRKAFTDDEDQALLVLNYINSDANRDAEASLLSAAKGARVKILPNHLNPEDYLSLFAASDCYVSLHRSEGLGQPLAEAMYLGKPVIATGYSGNLDFMSVSNCLLVKYRLVELTRDYPPYERGSVWAEADEGHAAQLMRWVYEHREEANALGVRAGEEVRACLNPRRSAIEIKNRLEHAFNEISTQR